MGDQSPRAESASPNDAVRRLFEETRRRLVDTGTRNRLVHVNRQSMRANALEVINELSDEVYRLLVPERRTMRFLATGRDKGDETDTPSLVTAETEQFDENRYVDRILESRLGPDGLQKRLLKLARDAKTAEEEQGVNILYLALGFLSWFEDKSSAVKREAPLVLVPVELIRNTRTSTYDIRARDDEVVTNLPLQERLKADFGIKLPDVEAEEEWLPSAYFEQVEAVISGRERWAVDRDGMQLGFFSFAKLLMFHDLDPDSWPDDAITEHPITRGLLYERFETEEPLFSESDDLDEKLPPHKLFHVVDADASQTKVIEEARSGRNLVVEGPPGTGKSQTITNIIAAAAKDGKRVLFVAEKMAALSVVHKRLLDVGLEDICLELHSKASNKKALLNELGRTLNAARAIPAMPSQPDELAHVRDRLNEIANELHKPIQPSGESAFRMLAQQVSFIGTGMSPPEWEMAALVEITADGAERIATELRAYGEALNMAGRLSEHPFYGVEELDLQPTDVARLEPELRIGEAAAAELAGTINEASEVLATELPASVTSADRLLDQCARLSSMPDLEDELLSELLALKDKEKLRETLAAGASWKRLREEAEAFFIDTAWDIDPAPLRAPIFQGQSSFFARWGFAYRRASRELAAVLKAELPKAPSARTDLVDLLLKLRSLRKEWSQDENWAAAILKGQWRGERTDFSHLLAALEWCSQAAAADIVAPSARLIALGRDSERMSSLISALESGRNSLLPALSSIHSRLRLDDSTGIRGNDLAGSDLDVVSAKFGSMASALDRYEEWTRVTRLRRALVEDGLIELLAPMEADEWDGERAAAEFLFARAEAIWKHALQTNPVIGSLRHVDRHELVQTFSELEQERLRAAVKIIRAEHLNQVPQGAQGAMGVIRGELAKKRAHMAIRRLFTTASEAIQRIKPVLLMSPISVAQYLPPGTVKFDLLIFDEASQVRPEDALGAIARADQIVVVGDKKQLPPTSFFDRLAGNADDEDEEEPEALDLLGGTPKLAELESILTLCEARGLGTRMLEWHYRSRDPSLMRVSNREFYEEQLKLPPSPLQDDPAYGLSFHRIEGAYDRGGRRDNRLEGAAVVRRVLEHAAEKPELSLGIVTFSSAQRNLITELLEYERRKNPVLDEFLREGRLEDVFVKNIENVQGDERDVILVSVGYGPTEAGGRLLNMNFGPINNEGGERRLNVLFTRARLRCEVYASFDPGDINLSKVTKEGPRVLKRFLEFAKTGLMDEKIVSGAGPDTPFEADVAAAIADLGFSVDHQVGSAGFLIDLAVRHPERPGTYILAVECDGATYHGALWARERDRLRQSVLEHLGWRFHRIWSTDWFYRRRDEVDRLAKALNAAVKASDDGIRIQGANDASPRSKTPSPGAAEEFLGFVEVPQRKMPHYVRSQVSVQSTVDPHLANPQLLARLAAQIVEDEGPIHEEEVGRRIAGAFGKQRAGARIFAVARHALLNARSAEDSKLRQEGSFWLTEAQAENPVVRDRSQESGTICKASNIAMSEITAALRIAVEDNAGGSDEDIIRATVRLFGFRRVGSDLQERLRSGLAALRQSATA